MTGTISNTYDFGEVNETINHNFDQRRTMLKVGDVTIIVEKKLEKARGGRLTPNRF